MQHEPAIDVADVDLVLRFFSGVEEEMTPLKALILAELHKRGPMRDVEIWQHSNRPTLQSVTLACLSLEEEGFIELPRSVRPVSFQWQLTQKGKDFAANSQGGDHAGR